MIEQLEYDVLYLRDHPELIDRAAAWFAERWDVPIEAYRESMEEGSAHPRAVPQWYVIQDDDGRIVAGAGSIDNDFHERNDLAPNLCALYVEPDQRGCGLARYMLQVVREDTKALGYDTLYLITDHTELYERLGWEFIGLVTDDEGEQVRMYAAPTGCVS